MKDFLKSIKTHFFKLFPYVVVFTTSLYAPADSDLGWHLKYGEYFFKTGHILKENILSTQMPGFQWINSSWGTDIITYSLFSKFGFLGLSLGAAIVITLIFYFLSKAFHLSFWQKALLFPTVILMEKPMFEVSFRGHLLTLLFVSILYWILSRYEGNKPKFLVAIPLLFTIWANIHGEFLLGLCLLFIWESLRVIQTFLLGEKKERYKKTLFEIKILILLVGSSFVATLVHPWGIQIYQEAIKHFGNPLERFIIEWLPFDRFSFLWWTLIAWELLLFISFTIIVKEKKTTRLLPWIGAPILLLVFSYLVRRYTWPLILISTPIVLITADFVKPKLDEIKTTIAVFIFVSFYGYVMLIRPPSANISAMSWNRYCEDFAKCSPKSAEFLRSKILQQDSESAYHGKILTFYNWGGFLIWNYPEIKPSIDGRMHLWRDTSGYSAFEEYYPYEQNWKSIDSSSYSLVYITPVKPLYKQMMKLVEEKKWSMPYSDSYSAIFIRNTN